MLLAHVTMGDVPAIAALCLAAFGVGVGYVLGRWSRR